MRRPTRRRSPTSCSSGPASSARSAPGLYSYLPLGWRVHRRVEQIIREEMDAIGGQEMLMPVLHPAELWKRTGRYGIPELFKLKDRVGRDLVLVDDARGDHRAARAPRRSAPTATCRRSGTTSRSKERDEPRPQAGVLRTREFIMKDSYTLDRDRGRPRRGLRPARGRLRPHLHAAAASRFYKVESDVGMMGGFGAHEYMAPSPAGEDRVVLCDGCDYAVQRRDGRVGAAAGDAAAGRAARGGAHAGRRDHRRRWPSSSASTRA